MATLISRLREALLGAEGGESHGTAPALCIKVRCAQCGEVITARVQKAYELQEVYADHPPAEGQEEHAIGYLLRKELVGAGCQNLIRLEFHFNVHRDIVRQCVEGGTLTAVEESG